MWLQKNERKTLAFYYQNFLAGMSSFPCKEPMDERVDRRLRDHGLIVTDIVNGPHAHMRVSLTPEGIRLGQIYNSWWLRSNLWYAEYIKNHWIWIIVSFLAGILGGVLVNWLSLLPKLLRCFVLFLMKIW